VVIAIIAILAAMLLHALQAARAKAKAAQCISNLKNSAFAMIMYGEDHEGLIMTYNSSPVLYASPDETTQRNYITWCGVLFEMRYLPSKSTVARCPSMGNEMTVTADYNDYRNSCYGAINTTKSLYPAKNQAALLMTGGSKGTSYRMIVTQKVSKSSFFPLLADTKGVAANDEWYVLNSAGTESGALHARHNHRIQAVFLDGNVESLTPAGFCKKTKEVGLFLDASQASTWFYKDSNGILRLF